MSDMCKDSFVANSSCVSPDHDSQLGPSPDFMTLLEALDNVSKTEVLCLNGLIGGDDGGDDGDGGDETNNDDYFHFTCSSSSFVSMGS